MLAPRFIFAGLFAIYPLVWLVSACQTTERKEPVPVLPPAVISTDAVLFCRDNADTNKSLIASLAKNGWQYAGPLHNDGINCTMTLWQCFDAKAACATGTK